MDKVDDVVVISTRLCDSESADDIFHSLLDRAEEIAEQRNLQPPVRARLIDADGEWVFRDYFDPTRPDKHNGEFNTAAISKGMPAPYYVVLEYSNGTVKIRGQFDTQIPFS